METLTTESRRQERARKISETPVGTTNRCRAFPEVLQEGMAHLRKGQSLVVRRAAKFCSVAATSPLGTHPEKHLLKCNPVDMTLKTNHHRYVIFPLAAKNSGLQ